MVKLSVTIPDDKVNDFKKGFLKINPIPMDKVGNPIYTPAVWFKICLKKLLTKIYREGKEALAREEWHKNMIVAEIDENIVGD